MGDPGGCGLGERPYSSLAGRARWPSLRRAEAEVYHSARRGHPRRREGDAPMDQDIKITGEPSETGERCAFTVDRPVLPDRSAYFGDAEAAKHSPFAAEILAL